MAAALFEDVICGSPEVAAEALRALSASDAPLTVDAAVGIGRLMCTAPTQSRATIYLRMCFFWRAAECRATAAWTDQNTADDAKVTAILRWSDTWDGPPRDAAVAAKAALAAGSAAAGAAAAGDAAAAAVDRAKDCTRAARAAAAFEITQLLAARVKANDLGSTLIICGHAWAASQMLAWRALTEAVFASDDRRTSAVEEKVAVLAAARKVSMRMSASSDDRVLVFVGAVAHALGAVHRGDAAGARRALPPPFGAERHAAEPFAIPSFCYDKHVGKGTADSFRGKGVDNPADVPSALLNPWEDHATAAVPAHAPVLDRARAAWEALRGTKACVRSGGAAAGGAGGEGGAGAAPPQTGGKKRLRDDGPAADDGESESAAPKVPAETHGFLDDAE
jgi:hypothetical protein